ncbi:hypothetical protein [Mesorhizobium sp. B1-1-8]|uniref:hypothetical protein n=1 Tax=Mesorhizobium sp. B1-1-8 TaxID=2589976 RepID=UPI00112A7CD9|nr:hypothetical protein [Mesorhizobium sp. B1-1-8]UCI06278.1 hypothetical protein FJ974_21015 [Mesorhizobium sp. B1-1-8]
MKGSSTIRRLLARTVVVCSAFFATFLVAYDANGTEFISNGGFEDPGCAKEKADGCVPWVFTGNGAVNDKPHSGLLAATVGGQGPGAGTVSQTVKLVEGFYSFSFWYFPRKIANGMTPAIAKIAGKIVFAKMLPSQEDYTIWTKCEIVVHIAKTEEGEKTIEFSAGVAPNYAGPLFDIDDVSLEK